MDTRKDDAAPIPEDDLHALVDGRLAGRRRRGPAPSGWPPTRRRRPPSMPGRPSATRFASLYAAAWTICRCPPSLVAAAERARTGARRGRRSGGAGAAWPRRCCWRSAWAGSPAASGAPAHGEAGMARCEPARQFAQQAAVAHAVFQPEVRHPVEVTAAQQEHLVQWLSKRLGRPLKVPVLAAQGYELVGGRLLPGDDGARAQFMYQNSAASGSRSTGRGGVAARAAMRAKPRSASWTMARCPASTGSIRASATRSAASCRARRCRSWPGWCTGQL